MADTKISAGADPGTLTATDKVPMARSASTTAYAATVAELAAYAMTTLPLSSATPAMDGKGAPGAATTVSRADHVHPTDTTRAAASAVPSPAATPPLMDGTAAIGVATTYYSLADHVHPTDTTLAPLASPTFTGAPAAPTVTPATDSTTKLATTAFVQSALGAAGAGVSSWNTRTGAVVLTSTDVTTALTFAPAPLNAPVFTGDARAVTATAGDNDTSIATTAFVQSAVAPAQNNAGRNLITNGTFLVAQRSNGPFTADNAYTADRWIIRLVTDTVSWTRAPIADAGRAAIGDESATWTLQNTFTGNAAAGAYNYVMQRMEDVRKLAGKTVTISFWANCTAGTPKIGVNVFQYFGTGGSPSTNIWVQATGNAVTISTAWARYSTTIVIPSISGKILGTNGDNWNGLALFFSSGANNNAVAGNIGVQSGTVNLWGVQIEYGSVATPLDYGGSPQQILAECQRFYQTGNIILNGYNNAGGACQITSLLPVTMRATPTIVGGTPTVANASGISLGALSPGAVTIYYTATAAGPVVYTNTFTVSADL